MSDYRIIPLTQGYVALVDDEDYKDLSQFKWCAKVDRAVYAVRGVHRNGRTIGELMHRRLLPGVERIDHVNGNGLDNRRANLRPANKAENARNRSGLTANNTSGFRGVTWHERLGKWQAGIRVDSRRRHLGYFTDPEAAARVFDTAAIEEFGEFAGYLNFAPSGGAS